MSTPPVLRHAALLAPLVLSLMLSAFVTTLAAPLSQEETPTPEQVTPTPPHLIGIREPTPTPEPTASPHPNPTPTPRPPGTPPRVGLQVGHLNSHELPDELAQLRTSTGARWGSVSEPELNLSIVNRTKPLLEAEGVVVDVIPATVPPSYDADAFVAIHADGSSRTSARGWKVATFWYASSASKALLGTVAASYGPGTGLPQDPNVTFNMKGYYAFNYRRYVHAIARTTPAIILEMGFMTNAADRAVLFGAPDRVAGAIAAGILTYLRQRDPNDGAALLPPEYPLMQPGPEGAPIRAAPHEHARVLLHADEQARIAPFDRLDGYYHAFVRAGDVRLIGWVREDQVVVADGQSVVPTPTMP